MAPRAVLLQQVLVLEGTGLHIVIAQHNCSINIVKHFCNDTVSDNVRPPPTSNAETMIYVMMQSSCRPASEPEAEVKNLEYQKSVVTGKHSSPDSLFPMEQTTASIFTESLKALILFCRRHSESYSQIQLPDHGLVTGSIFIPYSKVSKNQAPRCAGLRDGSGLRSATPRGCQSSSCFSQ
ncbi:hypothetical protein Anapl_09460 [Anas platyrhynchos]|uniref:Uncharacterized protein n=1 Tax=Anas platyrhynchos TaxID=8839 RepID=R0JZ48_ANAPL|nr:hypothetical protein Anapl_09460 [Anas platyrhynchos]